MTTTTPAMTFGLGLFTAASTVHQPRPWALAYRDLREIAVLAEELGFEELWFSEHHFFYDGQCPAPLTAAASVLAATERLRAGTGITLLPLYEPDRMGRVAADLYERSGGRLDLGVGQGFRELEFSGHGVRRRDRLARFLRGLEVLGEYERNGGARVLVGANTPATVARAAGQGHPVIASGLNPLDVCRELVSAHQGAWEHADEPWPGMYLYRNIWVTDEPAEHVAALDWVRASYVQYAGLGLTMSASGGAKLDFASDGDETLQAVVDTTITGGRDRVAEQLADIGDLGVRHVAFRLVLDGAPRAALEDQMRVLATDVIPMLRQVAR